MIWKYLGIKTENIYKNDKFIFEEELIKKIIHKFTKSGIEKIIIQNINIDKKYIKKPKTIEVYINTTSTFNKFDKIIKQDCPYTTINNKEIPYNYIVSTNEPKKGIQIYPKIRL